MLPHFGKKQSPCAFGKFDQRHHNGCNESTSGEVPKRQYNDHNHLSDGVAAYLYDDGIIYW